MPNKNLNNILNKMVFYILLVFPTWTITWINGESFNKLSLSTSTPQIHSHMTRQPIKSQYHEIWKNQIKLTENTCKGRNLLNICLYLHRNALAWLNWWISNFIGFSIVGFVISYQCIIDNSNEKLIEIAIEAPDRILLPFAKTLSDMASQYPVYYFARQIDESAKILPFFSFIYKKKMNHLTSRSRF